MYPNTILRGKYSIDRELGRGGMGQVFLGHESSGREVAIKRLAPELTGDTAVLERFRREGEALKALRHPNIVEFIEMFEEGGQHYIVTEYISGGTLLDLIRKGAMPMQEVRQIALDICDALVRAHKMEIIHRDIKPENIMLTSDHIAKLADFGIARLVNEGSRLTRTGMIVGTPDYLAPEIWAGQAPDAQTDLWSLGVVLFEMMSGKVPFEGDSLITIMRSITSATIPNLRQLQPGLPEGMVQIVERLLERERGKRYATARQLAADLEDRVQVWGSQSQEELARLIEIDPAILRATVDQYNDCCAKGRDRLFVKNPKFLRPLLGPRYYAVKVRTAFLGTMGGIRINQYTEVVDKKNAVIPGLYAGGFDAGGMYGDSYPITASPGLSSAFAINSGRIAGRCALEYLRRFAGRS